MLIWMWKNDIIKFLKIHHCKWGLSGSVGKWNLCQASHFLPETYNQANLKDLYNHDLEVEVTQKDIKK